MRYRYYIPSGVKTSFGQINNGEAGDFRTKEKYHKQFQNNVLSGCAVSNNHGQAENAVLDEAHISASNKSIEQSLSSFFPFEHKLTWFGLVAIETASSSRRRTNGDIKGHSI